MNAQAEQLLLEKLKALPPEPNDGHAAAPVRIVLDTNVVISALLWRGVPYQLLTALRVHPAAQLYSSPVLLTELTDVLTRPAATRQLAAIGNTPRAVLADYLEVVELVEPVELPR